jgi:hypothetical protein
VRLEKHYRLYQRIGIVPYGLLHREGWRSLFKFQWDNFLDDCIVAAIRAYGYRKSAECKQCRYTLICDGLERTYARIMGCGELKRVEGEIIRKPYHFRKHLFKAV